MDKALLLTMNARLELADKCLFRLKRLSSIAINNPLNTAGIEHVKQEVIKA